MPQEYRDRYKDQPRGLASFFGMIANIDDNMGRLDAFLEEKGLKDNTILVFLTDNGGTVGVNLYNAGMRGRKTELYEGGHRVPCFIRWPAGGLQAPADLPGLTECQDIAPHLARPVRNQDSRPSSPSTASAWPPTCATSRSPSPTASWSSSSAGWIIPNPPRATPRSSGSSGDCCRIRSSTTSNPTPPRPPTSSTSTPRSSSAMREHYNNWWAEVEPRINEFADHPDQWRPHPGHAALALRLAGRLPRPGGPGPQGSAAQRRMGHPDRHPRRLRLRTAPLARRVGPRTRGPAPEYQAADGVFPAGVALPVASVRLKVGDHDQAQPVAPNQPSAAFRLELPDGQARVQTWFLDSEGRELTGAYYVYVRHVKP